MLVYQSDVIFTGVMLGKIQPTNNLDQKGAM